MTPAAISQKHNATLDDAETVERSVKEAIVAFCEAKGYAYLGRIKTPESIAEKIETGRFEAWSKIDDFFACTIIIPTLLHESGVLSFLRTTFEEVEVKQRGSTKKSPQEFRFDATRFYGRLSIPPELPDQILLKFEVQIKSAFEHAWSAATHDIIYKSGNVDWKKERLGAQLKAAVEQLDSLVMAFDRSSEHIVEHSWPEIDNKQQLLAGFSQLFSDNLLPDELRPKDWSRFCDNAHRLLRSSNERLSWDTFIASALKSVFARANAEGIGRIPRSISLLQWAMAAWVEGGQLKLPLRNYHALITPELAEFYPSMASVQPIFDIDN